MIQIKCGTCGTSKGYKTEADGEITLPAAEESRLVSRGVAEYVMRPVISRAVPILDGVLETAITPVATPPVGKDVGGQGETSPDGDGGAEGANGGYLPQSAETLDIVDGHFTMESLMEMTRANMEKLAADLGVDVSKCKNKSDVAAALAAVEVEPGEPEDSETPPDLGAAQPVV